MKTVLWITLLIASASASERPNILFLFADDLGRYASAYADPDHPSPNDLIDTPVFDRLSAEGARFDQAFVSAPSCTPSRGAVYTGRHFFRNGSAAQLHNPWAGGEPDPFDEVNGMPNTLAAAGYHIGWSHKWHLRKSLIGGDGNHYAARGARVNRFSQEVDGADDPDAAKRAILDEVRGNFRDFLDARESGQPFFYSFNPTNTHRKWVRGSGAELWDLDPDELEGRLPPFLPDVAAVREDLADYLGEAMAFDAACGVILTELKERGELDTTLVVSSGDHGIPGFPRAKCEVHDFGARVPLAMRWPDHIEHGRVIDVPVSLVDLAPTFLAAAGTRSEDDPNGQNLLPALAPGGDASGLRGWALIGRERHVGSAREHHLPYPVRALRTGDFLYVRNFKPARWPMGHPGVLRDEDADPDFRPLANDTRLAFADIDASPTKAWMILNRDSPEVEASLPYAWRKRPAIELYDLRKDPHQMHNIADDPGYAEIQRGLEQQLTAELRANRDPRLDDAFDRPPYKTDAR